jgi:DNA-binding transcriptional regulator YhcF (GntR family)
MKSSDSHAENTTENVGRTLRRRPLARKKLSEMVEEELEQMIRRREFAEGDALPSERELMEFFNVGRPSVREALAALKRKGLVQINNGERARVSRPSADTIIGELSGMAKDFSPGLVVSPILSSFVCFSNPALCAMRRNTPRMRRLNVSVRRWS